MSERAKDSNERRSGEMNEIVVLREWVLLLIIFASVLSGAVMGGVLALSFIHKPARLG